jgi:hypothetical protein
MHRTQGRAARASHTRTVPSSLADANKPSDADHSTQFTLSLWPAKVVCVMDGGAEEGGRDAIGFKLVVT